MAGKPKINIPEDLRCFCGGELDSERLSLNHENPQMRLICKKCGYGFPEMMTPEGAINFARGYIMRRKKEIKDRLDYLRGEIEAERISYEEIAELQELAEYIDEDDVVLREWAGIPEHEEEQ